MTSLVPPRIDPEGIYHNGDACLILGLTSATLARARREKWLRFSRQGRVILYRGQWLLDWIDAASSAPAKRGQTHD